MRPGRRISSLRAAPAFLLSWPALFLSVAWPTEAQDPPEYEAHWVSTGPEIDGHLSDPTWALAPWSRPFMDIRGEGWPTPPYSTRVKLLWDDEYLYIAAELEEPHIWATFVARDAIIYHEDDFEIFLDPGCDGRDYFEIEVNALGTIFDLFLDRPYGRGGRANIEWNSPGLRAHIDIRGTLNDPSDEDRGWSVEMAIPWEDLRPPPSTVGGRPPPSQEGMPPVPGEEWRVNFSRVDWPLEIVPDSSSGFLTYRKGVMPTRENPHPEANWVWSPQGVVNMHLPEQWGIVRFQRPAAVEETPSTRGIEP